MRTAVLHMLPLNVKVKLSLQCAFRNLLTYQQNGICEHPNRFNTHVNVKVCQERPVPVDFGLWAPSKVSKACRDAHV